MQLLAGIFCDIVDGVAVGYHESNPNVTWIYHSNGSVVPNDVSDTLFIKRALRPVLKKGLVLTREYTQKINEYKRECTYPANPNKKCEDV